MSQSSLVQAPPAPFHRGAAPLEVIAEDAAFLWLWRDRAVDAPNIRLADFVRWDDRLNAHLDALRIAGPAGRELVEAQLPRGGPGVVFALASLAVGSYDAARLEAVLALPQALAAPREVVGALAWADPAAAVPAIGHLAVHGDAAIRAIGIAAWGARRRDPGAALARAMADADPAPRQAACKAAGLLGRADLLPQLENLATADDAVGDAAAWAAVVLGAAPALLMARAARSARAQALLLRRLPVAEAHGWLRELGRDPARQRDLLRGAGQVGDPAYMPWLLDRAADPAAGRLAGEAISLLAGVDLAYRDLDLRPAGMEPGGPTDDPASDDVAIEDDLHLPWPDAAKLAAWWEGAKAGLRPGTPCVLGQPKPAARLDLALADAFQRQRHAAALELAVRHPGRALFPVKARGRWQRAALERMRPG